MQNTQTSITSRLLTMWSSLTAMVLAPVKMFCLFLLRKIIPARGKRIIFMTTLYMLIYGDEKDGKDAVDCINEIFSLTDNKDTLEWAARLTGVLWDEGIVHKCVDPVCSVGNVDDDQLRRVGEKVIEVTPELLRYGRRDDMISDIINLITRGNRLQSAHC